MAMMRDIVNAVLADHTVAQKANFIKYLLSRRGEVLSYDPVTISIVATSRCTLSCDMCPTHSNRVPSDYMYAQQAVKDMDLASFREIIDRFGKATTVHIIGSGEPLLNKDFFAMVDYAASKKMVVKTFSNGTTILDNIDNIINSKLDGITISINGHDSGEFARMTGMDEAIYNTIYRAVEVLVRRKNEASSPIRVKLSFIIDRYNYKSVPEMIAAGSTLGVDHMFFCNFLSAPFDGLRADERALMDEGGIREEILAMFASCPPEVRKKLTPPVLIDPADRGNRCATHFSQIRFDGDGNVSSCSMMLLNMAGHGSYKDEGVWNNVFFRDMRRRFLSPDPGLVPEPCRSCPDNKGVHIGG